MPCRCRGKGLSATTTTTTQGPHATVDGGVSRFGLLASGAVVATFDTELEARAAAVRRGGGSVKRVR